MDKVYLIWTIEEYPEVINVMDSLDGAMQQCLADYPNSYSVYIQENDTTIIIQRHENYKKLGNAKVMIEPRKVNIYDDIPF